PKQSQRPVGGSQKKGTGGDKQPKTHAPKMPTDAFCAHHAVAKEHASIAGGGQQHDGTHKEVHSGRNAIAGRPRCSQLFETRDPGENTKGERNRKGAPVEFAGLTFGAPGREPRRKDEIEGKNSATDIT